ncbi:MAG: 50S ribosomal protein L18 [Candidatus Yanofskybacteria bacterium GW2011_GWA1_39_13]|uniref:Large ribosomal subunit protein uL18 n=1 Tax=Yanofskybacteria sp. (strain GW2011_GWA1_39_13) TaxID=1619019 RepID=A0A0G0PW09_YANXG|nr:MAG: 50S ribosomal protein L18 [Candidatus Yanofskybacteria bacterium GW2011_GWA1_39_13]
MNKNKAKQSNRIKRHNRVTAKVQGSSKRPRVAVFKSNQYIYAQVIDDKVGKTLMSISDYGGKKAKPKTKTKDKKSEVAFKMGELLAEKMKKEGITEVVFDRGGFKFHGRIKSVADGLIKGGVKI